jgi:hypothetical protein
MNATTTTTSGRVSAKATFCSAPPVFMISQVLPSSA